MSEIKSVSAMEILDSRGRPTIQAFCQLRDGALDKASVPAGASTGAAEALELRDQDANRYGGFGCLRAVANINGEINRAIAGKSFTTQADLDQFLIELDGSANKSRLGANAILGLSLAFCRAQAAQQATALFRHLAQLAGAAPRLPQPMINLFSGGLHGGGQTAIQDLQIVVPGATGISKTLEVMSDIFRAAVQLIADRYGMRLLTADEGGLAPPFPTSEAMIQAAVAAIEVAGYRPGEDAALTIDAAASQFQAGGRYQIDNAALETKEMVELIDSWCRKYPIISIEDGLGEVDWAGWQLLSQRLPEPVMVLGDDLLCTNPARIQQAIDQGAANSLLLKVNQIGTLTEALEAHQLARAAGWQVVVSARSGETEDNWLADLAAGWAGDYIKVGSITQSERLAKYNRLLYLEQMEGLSL